MERSTRVNSSYLWSDTRELEPVVSERAERCASPKLNAEPSSGCGGAEREVTTTGWLSERAQLQITVGQHPSELAVLRSHPLSREGRPRECAASERQTGVTRSNLSCSPATHSASLVGSHSGVARYHSQVSYPSSYAAVHLATPSQPAHLAPWPPYCSSTSPSYRAHHPKHTFL